MRKAVKGCDTVFHLAALIAIPYSYVAPAELRRNQRHRHAQRAAGGAASRASDAWSTPPRARSTARRCYVPIDEKHPLQGQSPYSASKIGADKMAESYYRSFDLPVVTLRPFNTFGPRQSPARSFPNALSRRWPATQVRVGSLDPTRDMTFVAIRWTASCAWPSRPRRRARRSTSAPAARSGSATLPSRSSSWLADRSSRDPSTTGCAPKRAKCNACCATTARPGTARLGAAHHAGRGLRADHRVHAKPTSAATRPISTTSDD